MGGGESHTGCTAAAAEFLMVVNYTQRKIMRLGGVTTRRWQQELCRMCVHKGPEMNTAQNFLSTSPCKISFPGSQPSQAKPAKLVLSMQLDDVLKNIP